MNTKEFKLNYSLKQWLQGPANAQEIKGSILMLALSDQVTKRKWIDGTVKVLWAKIKYFGLHPELHFRGAHKGVCVNMGWAGAVGGLTKKTAVQVVGFSFPPKLTTSELKRWQSVLFWRFY